MRRPPCNDIQDVIARITEENERALRGIENKRRTVIRVLNQNDLAANRPTGAPTELASDEEGVLWIYDEGTWRPCCTYGEEPPVTGFGLTTFQGLDPDDSYTALYVIDPDVPGTITQIAPFNPDDESDDYGDWSLVPQVWSEDRNYIYAGQRMFNVLPASIFYRMDADGGNKTVLFSENNPSIFGASIHCRGDTTYASYSKNPSPRPVKTINLTTGTEIGSFTSSIISGSTSTGYTAMHPTELRYLINFSIPTGSGHYCVDIDGTNIVGPLWRNDVGIPGGLSGSGSWHPSGNGVIVYYEWGAYPGLNNEFGIHMINDDGSDHELLFAPLYSGVVTHPIWSPDGSKFVFVNEDGLVYVFDEDGSGPTIIDCSATWPWDTVESVDWSLDGTKLICSIYDDDVVAIDILDIETEVITRIYETVWTTIDFIHDISCSKHNSNG